jgi:urease accessory protein
MNAPGLLGSFYGGLLHPLTVPVHIVALFGLALLIGQQRQRRMTILAFAVGLTGGLAALVAAVGETSAASVLLAGSALTGLTAAIGWPVPGMLGAPLAAIIGACIGLDSPPQAASIQGANAALAGTAIGALVLIGLIAAITARLQHGWPRIATRILGSWIAASATMVLALQFVR